MIRRQNTNHVLMVRPAFFGFNDETAANNLYQNKEFISVDATEAAQREFDNYVALLRSHGVEVWVLQDTVEPRTPDAVFPNNWFSTHITGELILYPMYAMNRRQERKKEALTTVGMLPGVTKVINLSGFEREQLYLEGTGSMCLDRVNKVVYCCASERSSSKILDEYCCELGYRAVYFHSTDEKGTPIYHTNVMMAVCNKYAVVCLESIENPDERKKVEESLTATGHILFPITREQVRCFAGNMMELVDKEGKSLIIMSQAAYRSLTPEQVTFLESYSTIIAPDLTTIESIGGGSARCMVAEIFV